MNFQTELNYLMDEFQWVNRQIGTYEAMHEAGYLSINGLDKLEVLELYKIHLQVSVHQLVNR